METDVEILGANLFSNEISQRKTLSRVTGVRLRLEHLVKVTKVGERSGVICRGTHSVGNLHEVVLRYDCICIELLNLGRHLPG